MGPTLGAVGRPKHVQTDGTGLTDRLPPWRLALILSTVNASARKASHWRPPRLEPAPLKAHPSDCMHSRHPEHPLLRDAGKVRRRARLRDAPSGCSTERETSRPVAKTTVEREPQFGIHCRGQATRQYAQRNDPLCACPGSTRAGRGSNTRSASSAKMARTLRVGWMPSQKT